MDVLAPTTIVVAMERLDQELAVLTERRQLLQQLLATFDDDNGDTVEWRQVERDAPTAAELNERFALVDAAPALKATAAPSSKGRKWDYVEVARVIADGVEAGKTATAALVEHYGVNKGMAGFLMKRCRELGYSRDVRVSFVPSPIERTSFDAQAARDVAAGPPVGAVRPIATSSREASKSPTKPAERFSVDETLAALGAS